MPKGMVFEPVWSENEYRVNYSGRESGKVLYTPGTESGMGHFRVPKTKAKCKTFLVEMSFICMIIKIYIHKKGFALGLVLKQRLAAPWKWPIGYVF